MRPVVLLLAVAACAAAPPPPRTIAKKIHPPLCVPSALERIELRLPSDPGIDVFVMSIATPLPKKGALVLTHGAGSAASALWDLSTADYSLMRKLACAGWDTYSVDVRGFGGSTMPPALLEPAEKNPPASRARTVQPDLDAAVRHALRTSGVDRVSLFGWSWGCVVAGMYASEHPALVDRLILFAPVYDRRWPKRHVTAGAWRTEKKQLFFDYFDDEREERSVLEEHVAALFRFTKGDEIRLPNGPYQDIYGDDAPIWDPRKVRAATLVVRGAADPASLDVHAKRLFEHLENARDRRYVVLEDAGHFAFRTRRYRALHDAVVDFLE